MNTVLLVILTILTSTALGLVSNIVASRIDPHVKNKNRLIIILFSFLLGALLALGITSTQQEVANHDNQPTDKTQNRPIISTPTNPPLPSPKSINSTSEKSANHSSSTESITEHLPNKDYDLLVKLLDKKEWEYADVETQKLILKIGKQEMGNIKNIEDFIATSKSLDWADRAFIKRQKLEEFLYPATIKVVSCDALKRINQLWLNASGGRFGFSTQKKIYIETTHGKLDGKVDLNGFGNPALDFANHVGWFKRQLLGYELIGYSEYTYNMNAPYGHLPSSRRMFSAPNDSWGNYAEAMTGTGIYYMMFRLEQCGV